jgi:hypothetical protein
MNRHLPFRRVAFVLALMLAACEKTPAPVPSTNDVPSLIKQAIELLETGDTETFVTKILDPQHVAALQPGETPRLKSQLAAKKEYYLSILRAASTGKASADANGDRITIRASTPAGNALVQCVRRVDTWYVSEMVLQPADKSAP